jgi:serine/threonine protein kinase
VDIKELKLLADFNHPNVVKFVRLLHPSPQSSLRMFVAFSILTVAFCYSSCLSQIGVSIPDDKKIPIMMISELCENGDLFDYIRNVPAPSLKVVVRSFHLCFLSQEFPGNGIPSPKD